MEECLEKFFLRSRQTRCSHRPFLIGFTTDLRSLSLRTLLYVKLASLQLPRRAICFILIPCLFAALSWVILTRPALLSRPMFVSTISVPLKPIKQKDSG